LIYLVLSILSSTIIFIVFRLYKKYGVNTMQAIVFNYFFACIVGYFGFIDDTGLEDISSQKWLPGALMLGFLFITVFNLAAITTQKSGLSVVSVATKMSVAIPVFCGIFLYDESMGILKLAGILLALVAVYLTSIKTRDGLSIKWQNLIFPLLVFLGSGIIDTSIKFLETSYVSRTDVGLFSTSIFATAGLLGVLVMTYQAIQGKLELQFKNVLGGIALGIPNYFSIYFLVLALRSEGYESSTIFTMNHVSIVALSTILGIVLFKEKLIPKNWIGLILAIVSIILVANSAL